MAKDDIELAPDGDDWIVQVQGSELEDKIPLGKFEDKDEAELWARHYADERDVELFIKGEDGRIQDKDSHGNDPAEIEG